MNKNKKHQKKCKCGKLGCTIQHGKDWLKKVMKTTVVNIKKELKTK